MWHEGTIGVPKKEGGFTVVHYWVKAYDEPSQYGIEGGRISKATLKISGEVVYNYDRGLDVPPQNEAAEMALAILMHESPSSAILQFSPILTVIHLHSKAAYLSCVSIKKKHSQIL